MIVSVKLGDPFGDFFLCNLKRITLTLAKLGHFKVFGNQFKFSIPKTKDSIMCIMKDIVIPVFRRFNCNFKKD
jgi:hypothetical protein